MGHHDLEIMATLELWASSLRKVKSLMRPLFAQDRAALNAGLFLDGCLAMSVARRDGCAPRPPVILALAAAGPVRARSMGR